MLASAVGAITNRATSEMGSSISASHENDKSGYRNGNWCDSRYAGSRAPARARALDNRDRRSAESQSLSLTQGRAVLVGTARMQMSARRSTSEARGTGVLDATREGLEIIDLDSR
jgi:hypothetical protein